MEITPERKKTLRQGIPLAKALAAAIKAEKEALTNAGFYDPQATMLDKRLIRQCMSQRILDAVYDADAAFAEFVRANRVSAPERRAIEKAAEK